jgi:hypothetical protein
MRIKEIRIACDGDSCSIHELEGIIKCELVVNDVNIPRHVNIEQLSFQMTKLFDAQGWKKLNRKHYCPSCWDERKRKDANEAAIGN